MDRELHARVLEWLRAHRDDIVRDTSRLVKIRSVATYDEPPYPTGNACKQALEEALQLGREHGFIAHNYKDYCGSICLKDEPPFIGFWGHLDVVPEGINWENDPFTAVERDGFLIGRGVGDNKGPTVGTLYVIKCLKELNVPLKHNMKLFFGTDEEHGMKDAIYYAEHYESPDLTLIADSGFPVSYGEKGVFEIDLWSDKPLSSAVISLTGGVASNVIPAEAACVLRRTPAAEAAARNLPEKVTAVVEGDIITFTAHGVAAHSAGPEKGTNAIWLLMRALVDSHALPLEDEAVLVFPANINDTFGGEAVGIQMEDELSGKLTCAGTMTELKDGKVKLHLNIRYCVTASGEDIQEKINARASANGYTPRHIRDSKPAYFPRENPIIDALTTVYNDITGKDEKPFVMAGGTYARKLPRALGYGPGGFEAPTPEWQKPGHGGGHGPDEAIHIDNLLQAMAVIAMGVVEADGMV